MLLTRVLNRLYYGSGEECLLPLVQSNPIRAHKVEPSPDQHAASSLIHWYNPGGHSWLNREAEGSSWGGWSSTADL